MELAETNMIVRQNKDFIQDIENALRERYYKHSTSLLQTTSWGGKAIFTHYMGDTGLDF